MVVYGFPGNLSSSCCGGVSGSKLPRAGDEGEGIFYGGIHNKRHNDIMSEKTKIKVEVPDDTALTPTEKRLITETWNAHIKKDITYHGCLIFIRYF